MDLSLIEKVITGLAVLVNLLLGFLIWTRNRRSSTGILFFLFTISLAGASFANFYSLNSSSDLSTLFWIRMVMFFAGPMGTVFYLFVVAFPNDKIKIRKDWFWFVIFFSIVMSIMALSPLLFSGITHKNGSIQPLPGKGIGIYILGMVSFLILGMVILSRKFFSGDRVLKQRVKYMVIGLALTLGCILFFNVFLVNVFKISNYQFLAGFFTLFYISFTAYAIIKHQLFNIKVIATETTVVALSITLFVEVFVSNNITEGALKAIVWMLTTYGGLILIKSVKNEIKQKDELKILATKLDKANMDLEHLDEAKDNFLSMAAHELNTPIAAIEGYLSMIIEENMGGKIPNKAMVYLKNVFLSSKRLAGLVHDLLNVSRIESNRIHIVYTEEQIEDVIDQSIAEVKIKADEVGHKLIWEKPSKPLPKTYIDMPRIVEVIINIIGNAIKYTDPPGKIEVKCHADDGKIVVSIEDNGRGISKDKAEHVFEKFTQVNVLTDQIKGTGLGMFISKNLIELHKGKLWFESSTDAKDHGTTFYFSLPILKTKPFDPHEGEGALLQTKNKGAAGTAQPASATAPDTKEAPEQEKIADVTDGEKKPEQAVTDAKDSPVAEPASDENPIESDKVAKAKAAKDSMGAKLEAEIPTDGKPKKTELKTEDVKKDKESEKLIKQAVEEAGKAPTTSLNETMSKLK